ncbi:hypothetical protein ABN034_12450 [Actinopolymorpha sp. B11F2]|uniref:hypothetical protein n=1 Tax=Actinopolymorpha sp. B11F2 TaxID=3160862 RepID=UPI0032E3F038
MRKLILAVAAVALLAGCGGAAAKDEQEPARAKPKVEQVEEKPKQPTAEQVTRQLAEAIPTVKLFRVYTAEDDPNDMLGRPGGYLSKTAFHDSRAKDEELEYLEKDAIERGGSVEMFATEQEAKQRYEYLSEVVKAAAGLVGEYDYLSGTTVVRVSRFLTPDQAKEYEAVMR